MNGLKISSSEISYLTKSCDQNCRESLCAAGRQRRTFCYDPMVGLYSSIASKILTALIAPLASRIPQKLLQNFVVFASDTKDCEIEDQQNIAISVNLVGMVQGGAQVKHSRYSSIAYVKIHIHVRISVTDATTMPSNSLLVSTVSSWSSPNNLRETRYHRCARNSPFKLGFFRLPIVFPAPAVTELLRHRSRRASSI